MQMENDTGLVWEIQELLKRLIIMLMGILY